MTLNCVIIEDEKHAIELLSDNISALPDLRLLKVFSKPSLALNSITVNDQIDILFMDIHMPGISGLELASLLRDKTRFLIFTTSQQQHALAAFEVEADQYLIKPITFAKLAAAVAKIKRTIAMYPDQLTNSDEVYVKSGVRNKLIQIKPLEIIYLESKDNYVLIHLPQESIITYLTLKEAHFNFNSHNILIQVHKSFVISKSFIDRIDGMNVIMKNKVEIPIGTSFKDSFLAYIKDRTVISGRNKVFPDMNGNANSG